MGCHDDYRQWPFLNQEEFELACAFFDQKYVRAKLGPTRKIFKIRSRRVATTGNSYIEILRLLQPPDDADDLSRALEMLGGGSGGLGGGNREKNDVEMMIDTADEDTDQPYVTYEIHLHPTYSMPTLWFTLHDLPMGEPTFDLDSVYRYLVPPEFKSKLRAAGITGGVSAAPHPITDVPAFFIHPCQTKEAMENFECPMEEYLMVWIGLVGGCVGLWVPPEMVQEENIS
ncbi:autophagy-related protein-like protein Atg10 [Cadophora sp. DSE1049]|nr:autophagy-related protein-like protein Atg10 [Cadophora sp. DSE1049]